MRREQMTFENGHENGKDATCGRHYPPSRDESTPLWGTFWKGAAIIIALIVGVSLFDHFVWF